jgi:hypothetical protein
VIRWLTRLECVKYTGLVYGQTHCILRPLLLLTGGFAGIPIDPDILFLEGLCLLLWLLFEINLAVDTSGRQIIQPYPGWSF